MKRYMLILILLFLASCTNHLEVKVSDPDAQKSVDAIKETLDDKTSEEFTDAYFWFLVLENSGKKGVQTIIMTYQKKSEDVTLGDILKRAKK